MQGTICLPKADPDPACPVCGILDQVGGKWTALVISHLAAAAGPLRFSEIKRRVGGVSQRMLTETVRSLERDGVLLRTVYSTIQPKVEYSLTSLGASLVGPVQALVSWALDHREPIQQARSRFDRRRAAPAPALPPGNGNDPSNRT